MSDLLSGASGGADLISLDGWLGQIHLFQLTVAGELDVDAGVLDDPEGTGRVEFKADAIQRINDRVQTYLNDLDAVVKQLGAFRSHVDCDASPAMRSVRL